MNSNFWHKYFFLRLLLALIGGILIGKTEVLLLVIAVPLFIYSYLFRWRSGECLGFACMLGFLFLGGWIAEQTEKTTLYPYAKESACYKVMLTEYPSQKPKSWACKVKVLTQVDSSFHSLPINRDALLYLVRDSLSPTPHRGDVLLINASLASDSTRLWGQKHYLLHQGLSTTAVVFRKHWIFLGHTRERTLQQRAEDARESVLSLYQSLGFHDDNYAVLSALTVGYKKDLSKELKNSYSVAGISHILALSGLHVGLLTFFFFWWEQWDNRPWVQWIRAISASLLLLLFSFFTGLGASVVRASLMLSLYFFSPLASGNRLGLNVLAATAFGMLLVRPMWLYDVGFQLSFCAVGALIILQPKLAHCCYVRKPFLRKIWQLGTVSVAAQIGTQPLVFHYFARFSVHFLWTNLLIVPWVTLILYAAVVLLLLTPFPAIQQFWSIVVKGMIDGMNELVNVVERLPFASIDSIRLDVFETLVWYVMILCGVTFSSTKRPVWLLRTLSILLFLLLYHLPIWKKITTFAL